MRNLRRATLWIVGSFLLSGCSITVPDAPQRPLRPSDTHHYLASAASGDTLSLSITGRVMVKTASIQRFNAGIANGTATLYHYTWFTADCLSNCDSAPMSLFAEGDGMSTANIPYASTNDYKIISVHVTELNGTGRAGSTRIETEGPNLLTSGSGVSFVFNPCDYYENINWFPLTNGVGRNYRRNYCNNSVSWQP